MKLTITLTDEAAACLWDDVTWGGQHPRALPDIAQSYLEGRAAVSVAAFPAAHLPALMAKFRAAHPLPVPPQAGGAAPQLDDDGRPDCDCGSEMASWHGEVPDLRQYCCEECYAARSNPLPGT